MAFDTTGLKILANSEKSGFSNTISLSQPIQKADDLDEEVKIPEINQSKEGSNIEEVDLP